MGRRKKLENESPLLDDRTLRDKCVGKFEVLEKVKELLLLPGIDFLNVKGIADYYEAGVEAIQSLYKDNNVELDLDGTPFKMDTFGGNIPKNSCQVRKSSMRMLCFPYKSDNIKVI